jgi:phosphoglycolate phosphatase
MSRQISQSAADSYTGTKTRAPACYTPRMPSRVILFDFDGVIADSLAAYFPVFSESCRDLGFNGPATLAAFLEVFDTNAVKGLLRAGVPILKLRRLGKTLGPRVAALNRHVSPFPGMPELVNRLSARFPVYVVTSNVTAATEEFLARHGMNGVRGVVGADQEASKVKKIRRIHRAHRGAEPWYIGDTRGDMIEGRAARAITVAVTWGWHDRARLETGHPDHVVESVDELAALLHGEAAVF